MKIPKVVKGDHLASNSSTVGCCESGDKKQVEIKIEKADDLS